MAMAYVFLASGTVAVGIILTFGMLATSQRLGINLIDDHLWALGIPAALSLILNILLLELYRKLRRGGEKK